MTIRERFASWHDDPKPMLRVCGWISVSLMLLSIGLKAIGVQALGGFIQWVGLGLCIAGAIAGMASERK